MAGVVAAVGPRGSGRVAVGDHVYCTGIKGGMAQYAVRCAELCPSPCVDGRVRVSYFSLPTAWRSMP